MNPREVTLPEMLAARERRVDIQTQMLESAMELVRTSAHAHKIGNPQESCPDKAYVPFSSDVTLVSFTMNIAGPLKNNDRILRAFHIGTEELELSLRRCRIHILDKYEINEATGNEAFYTVDAPALAVKRICCEMEDNDELGRLYDMDVLAWSPASDPVKIERQALGFPERSCLICGAPGKDCASRRVHTVAQLQEKTRQIIDAALEDRDISRVTEYAVRSLLYEVCTTPKPGLVDRNNSGSHNDMDIYTFMKSAASLYPYFERCFAIGRGGALRAETPRMTFSKLRVPGKFAENRMLRATDGVNTHKGAIFTMGIVCGALGRLSVLDVTDQYDPARVAQECAAMTEGIVAEDMSKIYINEDNAGSLCVDPSALPHLTHGQRLYLEYGITGVRGQIEAGLPAVIEHGLPLLERLLDEGKSEDEAGTAVLLTIIAHTDDTNIITRSDVQTQRREARRAARILDELYPAAADDANCPASGSGSPADGSDCTAESSGRAADYRSVLEALDADYISRHLSPGGSADLLAVCWMLHFCRSL